MTPTTVFSTKAEKYAKYRWDYAPQAIQTIFDQARLSAESVVADIGAGTGILTRHFVGKVKTVFAVEPNLAMQQMMVKTVGQPSSLQLVAGAAEATALADQSVDLISVAQAIHWFEPEPTKAEFHRVLKPGGWLAILRNYGTDDKLNEAMSQVLTLENGVNPSHENRPPAAQPVSFYYGHNNFLKFHFPFTLPAPWENFIGSWGSASPAPDEDHPLYANFEQAVRRVFDRFSVGGLLAVQGVTELCLGQISQTGGADEDRVQAAH
jgi:ubiquinone/menaquinone biosynthesis C-methylase UbiE